MRNDDSREQVERVKAAAAAVGLPTLAERWGVEVIRGGRSARCPNGEAHSHGDRNPSLSFTANGEAWKCHACGEGGDVFSLWTLLYGGGFREALEGVAAEVGVALEDRAGMFCRTFSPASQAARRKFSAEKARPPLRETPAPTPLSAEAEALSRALWAIVEPLGPTPALRRWIDGRAGRSGRFDALLRVAHDLGWRDWSPAAEHVRAALRGSTVPALVELGFMGAEDRKPWWPLDRVERGEGFFMPAFLPGGATPYRWRFRCYDPKRIAELFGFGREVKAWSPKGSGRVTPYGLGLPADRLSWVRPAVGAELVVICEGEPDWLALSDELGPLAGVVCLTNLSSGWPSWLTPLLSGALAVVVACHNVHGQRAYDGLYTAARGGPRLYSLLVPEDDDWSDRHARGELFGTLYQGEGRGLLAEVVDNALARMMRAQ